MAQDPKSWQSINNIPTKNEATVLSADDDSKSGIGWFSMTEKVGIAVMSQNIYKKTVQRESMNVCATLGESGWSLKAVIRETNRQHLAPDLERQNFATTRASVFLEADCDFSVHILDVVASGLAMPILEKAIDVVKTQPMFQHADHVDRVSILALLVMEKAENACNPRSGDMLPSQRTNIKHMPPLEWEGWSLFLDEVLNAVEVFDVMNR
jgi:hypothetical protein